MDLNDFLVFTKVAELGSFTLAARSLRMPVSTVSRKVSDLERDLGLSLLIRTTRNVKVTELGKAYLGHGAAIAAELEKAQSIASSLQSVPQGTLKLTATADFGNHFLGPIVAGFLERYPRVQADIVLTDRVVDLIGEGFDLAIRVGDLDDSGLLARRIGNIDLQLFASPEFLKRSGEPRSCDDLATVQCIRFTGEEDSDVWKLSGPKGDRTVRIDGRISSNDLALVRRFAIAGKGIALLPHFLCEEEVRAGRLKVILKSWFHSAGAIHVVYPNQRYLLPRVRAFIDHLARECEAVKWRL